MRKYLIVTHLPQSAMLVARGCTARQATLRAAVLVHSEIFKPHNRQSFAAVLVLANTLGKGGSSTDGRVLWSLDPRRPTLWPAVFHLPLSRRVSCHRAFHHVLSTCCPIMARSIFGVTQGHYWFGEVVRTRGPMANQLIRTSSLSAYFSFTNHFH